MGSGVSSPWEPSYAAPERGVARARGDRGALPARAARRAVRARTSATSTRAHTSTAARHAPSASRRGKALGMVEATEARRRNRLTFVMATWPCPRSVRGTAEVSRVEGKKGTVGEQGDCLRAQGARPRRGGCDARLVRGRADGLDDAHRERVARAPCGGRWCACGSVPAPCAQHLAAYAPRVVSPARFLIAPSPLPAVSPSPAIPPRGTHAVQSWRLQARARCWSSTRL